MWNKKGQLGSLSLSESNIFNNFTILIIFVVVVFVSGLLAGITYYDMNLMNSVLHTVNFDIPIEVNTTSNMTTFQDILGITIYPILGLSSALPYLVYFMIFGFIIALAITAYLSSKNGVFFVVHLLFTFFITYLCFILSNVYITLLQNQFINSMMVNFTVYNTLMIYLPQVVFFTSLLFSAIAFVNLMKPQSNLGGNQTSLNYGGDY